MPPREVRTELDLTQEEFAAAIRVPVATIRNWEPGTAPLDPAARTLLALISADPPHALKLLGWPSSRPAGGQGRARRFA
jgi:putative transcriptional regulator